MTARTFQIGARVRVLPHHDLFMRGAVYGDVVAIGRTKLTVKLDKVKRPVRLYPVHVAPVD